LSLVPLSYAGGELPEVNIGLMPGLVTSYEQGYGWKNAEVGKELNKFLLDKGIIIVSWIWQAGGVASRTKPIVEPEDARGLKIRGGSREMDMILKAAGAAVVSLPSNEIYAAMQTGAMDAALTSSTSLISFRLEEVSKSLTTGRGKSYWFMLEPLMMSKAVFDKLSKEHQGVIMAVGADMEAFARKSAQLDDSAVAAVYQKTGAKVVDLNDSTVKKWQAIARTTAWKDYGERNENCAKLLKLAEKTL
jgi:TRAP-type C4-dicarboxylate transport system substrate-binding protein